MMTDDHFHLDSLERFTESLAAAEFRLVSETNPPVWRGDIHPAFAPLTDATTMDIVIVPGWPFQPPALFVKDLNTNHSTLDGLVCMWQDGDYSDRWTSLEGLFSRIEEWCENAKRGWEDDDLEYDAFLNFRAKHPLVATFDLTSLGIHRQGWGEFHGTVNRKPFRLDIVRGRQESYNQLRGLWFHVGPLRTPPPRKLSEVLRCLSRHQRRGLQKGLAERRSPEPFTASGGVDIILFCWERRDCTDLLVMACKGKANEVEAIALQPGPNDENSLILRAGPDASLLRSCRVTLFGAGALGGHAATLLASSGIGFMEIVDPDVLLPGNAVRHVAGHSQVGAAKVHALKAVIEDHAPWIQVIGFLKALRTPSEICARISEADIVIDTTGNEAFIGSLAMVAKEIGKPLVSGALYRGGFISRVQRQALPSDTYIPERHDPTRYPLIPAGVNSNDFAVPQLGCSAPINNAPPSAVACCASLIAQATIDTLVGRFELAEEVIDVYRAIPEYPFNQVGRVYRSAG